MKSLFIIIFLFLTPLLEAKFGYVSYSDPNIGDDIQSLAAKQFLPKNSIPIDREFLGVFESDEFVHTIINGWFMNTKDHWWHLKKPPPDISWPPASSINPLIISMHLNKGFIKTAFSEQGIQYFKDHGPVGARDLATLQEFQARNIPAYFSGCLTLTLNNPYKNETRNNIIYVVDLDDEIFNYVQANAPRSQVIRLSHNIPGTMRKDHDKRLELAQDLINKYCKARCVITRRFHAAVPCLALGTPVLLIGHKYDYRFRGIVDLLHNATKTQLLNGEVHFDFDHPPSNSDSYLPLRENLIRIVNQWVKENKSQRSFKE